MCVRCFSTFSEQSLFLKRRWCRKIRKMITTRVRTPRQESLYFKFDVIFQALSIPPFDESWNGLCFDVFRCFRLCLKSLLFLKGAGITQFEKMITPQVRTARQESLYIKFDVIFQALSILSTEKTWNGWFFAKIGKCPQKHNPIRVWQKHWKPILVWKSFEQCSKTHLFEKYYESVIYFERFPNISCISKTCSKNIMPVPGGMRRCRRQYENRQQPQLFASILTDDRLCRSSTRRKKKTLSKNCAPRSSMCYALHRVTMSGSPQWPHR